MAQLVEQYQSDESDEEIIVQQETKRREKRNFNWDKSAVFPGLNEAVKTIKAENLWSFYYQNRSSDGLRKYYRCNKVPKRGQQCDAALYLLCREDTTDVVLFKSKGNHNHENLREAKLGLSEDTKKMIEELFDLKLKPKKIYEKLIEKGFKPKNKKQLENYLTFLRRKKFGESKISLGQLEAWCESHSALPEEDNKPFVVSFEIKYEDELEDDEDETEDNLEEKSSYFRVFISSKVLLANICKSPKLHADATYKLIWEGMPVLVTGSTDMNRSFHPCGLAICSNEKTGDFKFIFGSIKLGVTKINLNIDPDFLISDAADAIRNAFQIIFGYEKILIMCWAHLRRNVTKKIDSLVNERYREEMIEDVDTLQLASSTEIFDKASRLFIKKWNSKGEKSMVKYMNDEWFTSHRNWYEGIAHFTPSTNNALEAFNGVIKKEETFRERIPLSAFLTVAYEAVEKWSKEFTNGSRVFATSVTIELKEWTKAYHWVKTKPKLVHIAEEDFDYYYCPAGGNLDISEEDITIVKNMSWKTFNQFKAKAFKVWTVKLPKENWKEGVCSCPHFFKTFICKHILGIAMRLKFIKPPPEARSVPIGQKRRRGRPKKATRALLVD